MATTAEVTLGGGTNEPGRTRRTVRGRPNSWTPSEASDIEPGSAQMALATSRCTRMAAAAGGQSLSRNVRRIGIAA